MDAVNHEGGIPPYRQVAEHLRQRIRSGELTGRLRAEKALAQEYGVAIGTIRKCLEALRNEGLIVTFPGWGSMVVPEAERPG